MAAIDIEEEVFEFSKIVRNNYSLSKDVMIDAVQFLTDFAERVREAQMRSDIDYLHEQGYDEASSKLLLSAPIITIINK